MQWPKQFSDLSDPRFAIMYLEQMPCTAKRHAEALQKLSQWLELSHKSQNVNERMREITQRAKSAIEKHNGCKK